MKTITAALRNYTHRHKEKRQLATIYYKKLIKASLLISIVPIVVVVILIIYGRLTFLEGIIGAVAVFFGSTFFAKPYLDDLSSLTSYVEHLALNKNAAAPPLSFLGNVDELSDSVKNLHQSWGHRNIETEAALAESTILFDTIPDILLMLDKNNNILRANNAATTNFHINLVGVNIKDLVLSEEFPNTIKLVLKSGKGASVEIPLQIHGINQDYLAMIEKFPVKSIAGVSIVLIMHNITESRRRKEMLKDFVANASHEIRTPLTSVSGFIENLQAMEEDNEHNKKTRKSFLAIMAEQTERMSNLINDLLSLSKVEMNEDTRPTDMVDVSDILKSVKRRLKWQASERNIKISISKKTDIPEVIGDKNELTQVFTNILSNAIKYGYADTVVKITADVISQFHKSQNFPANCNKLLLVSIEDKGEGIAEQHIPRVTERFYRVDKARSRKVGGTGLGLAITKHIINRHRGDLIIESIPGKGSIFTVRLPIMTDKKVKAL